MPHPPRTVATRWQHLRVGGRAATSGSAATPGRANHEVGGGVGRGEVGERAGPVDGVGGRQRPAGSSAVAQTLRRRRPRRRVKPGPTDADPAWHPPAGDTAARGTPTRLRAPSMMMTAAGPVPRDGTAGGDRRRESAGRAGRTVAGLASVARRSAGSMSRRGREPRSSPARARRVRRSSPWPSASPRPPSGPPPVQAAQEPGQAGAARPDEHARAGVHAADLHGRATVASIGGRGRNRGWAPSVTGPLSQRPGTSRGCRPQAPGRRTAAPQGRRQQTPSWPTASSG